MPEETSRFKTPYPSKDQDPWYDPFKAMVVQVDEQLFALHEERNQIVFGGGTLEWDGTTLTWSSQVVFISPTHGLFQTMAAGSMDIADGQFWFVSLARGPTGAVVVTSDVSTTIDIDGGLKVMAVRVDDTLYFFSGLSLEPGESSSGFTAVPDPDALKVHGRYRYSEIPVSADDVIEARDWAHRDLSVTRVTVMMLDVAVTTGNYTLQITDEAGNDLLNTVAFDLASLTDEVLMELTLTATTAYLDIDQDEQIKIIVTSDNADLEGGGLYIVIDWEER